MASFHCTAKAGPSGSGAAHAEYIEREGKYKTKDRDDLEAVESGNLPEWAKDSADFWQASDALERANAAAYREYEIALPREMTKEQRLELVHEFIAQELGDKHAYTFAIHNPRAALEGGEQPHAHIMFSERVNDGIKRASPEHHFKQYSSKQPERGGCKKANSARKTTVERKADLVELRERFAVLQNKHLAKHGHTDRVTHLSLKEQGIDRPVAEHLGPQLAAMEKRGQPTRKGADHAQLRDDINEISMLPEMESKLNADRELLSSLRAKLAEQAKQLEPEIDQTAEQEKKLEAATKTQTEWAALAVVEEREIIKEMIAEGSPVQKIGANLDKAEWQEAMNLLKARAANEPCAVHIPKAGQEYTGQLLFATDTHIVQHVGRGTAVAHDLRKLDNGPALGDQLDRGTLRPGAQMVLKYGPARGAALIVSTDKQRVSEIHRKAIEARLSKKYPDLALEQPKAAAIVLEAQKRALAGQITQQPQKKPDQGMER